MNGDIKLKLLKEDERPVISLSTTQIRKLLSASKPYPRLRMRILLALGTGLRRGDIGALKRAMSPPGAQRPGRAWDQDVFLFRS